MTLSTKARWDKYNGYVGNFRAPLGFDTTADHGNKVLACGINNSGAAVIGAGQTGIVGLVIFPMGNDYITGAILPNLITGDSHDFGKHGEITNFAPTTWNSGTSTFDVGTPAAGTDYFAHADGSVNATKGTDGVYVGHTVESSRLIVNMVEHLGVVQIADLNTTGTASGSTTLHGDGSWS